MVLTNYGMPTIGKVLLSGTFMACSLSSTLFLHGITLPYTIKLEEVISPTSESINTYEAKDSESRLFEATRLNIFGLERKSTFYLKDVTKINIGHPFASFRANNKWYYINIGSIDDKTLKYKF